MAKQIIIDQVYKLSQEEGMTDQEIGNKLGYSRVQIARIRKENNIPKSNFAFRKDDPYKCMRCKEIFLKRRNESKMFCPECEKIALQEYKVELAKRQKQQEE